MAEHEVLTPFMNAAHEAGIKFVAAGGFLAEGAAKEIQSGAADLVRPCSHLWPAKQLN